MVGVVDVDVDSVLLIVLHRIVDRIGSPDGVKRFSRRYMLHSCEFVG